MRFLALLFGFFLSGSVLASTLVLPESNQGELRQLVLSSWQQCGLSTWCEDDLIYYRDSFVAEATLNHDVFSIELFAEYSPQRLAQLQLHLRQDGFVLTTAEIEGRVFSVGKVIEATSIEEADRALILFLNRFSQHSNRELNWQGKGWSATLNSDGELISLTLIQD